MNRWKLVLSVASLSLMGFMNAFAGQHEDAKMGENMAKGMAGHQCGPMGGKQNLVATTDGGVVVLCGKHLIKFDKNLKLVKDVEVPCSCCAKKGEAAASGESENCSRHSHDGMKKMDEKKAADDKKPAAETKAAEPVKK